MYQNRRALVCTGAPTVQRCNHVTTRPSDHASHASLDLVYRIPLSTFSALVGKVFRLLTFHFRPTTEKNNLPRFPSLAETTTCFHSLDWRVTSPTWNLIKGFHHAIRNKGFDHAMVTIHHSTDAPPDDGRRTGLWRLGLPRQRWQGQ